MAMNVAPTKSIYDVGMDDDMDGGKYDRDLGGAKKRGQNRGLDGKFESSMKDLDHDIGDMGVTQDLYHEGRNKQTNKQNK